MPGFGESTGFNKATGFNAITAAFNTSVGFNSSSLITVSVPSLDFSQATNSGYFDLIML